MASGKKKVKNKYTFAIFKRELPLHLMLLPGLILVAVFSYTPMAGLHSGSYPTSVQISRVGLKLQLCVFPSAL
ncbi:MAG: hypothetical protein ACLVLH_27990 [Eisenbergiella massiliensis]